MDITVGFALVSFMDAYFGYHQIQRLRKDRLHHQWRDSLLHSNFFRLKIAWTTYQKMMNKMFSTQIGWNMDVYINVCIVLSHCRLGIFLSQKHLSFWVTKLVVLWHMVYWGVLGKASEVTLIQWFPASGLATIIHIERFVSDVKKANFFK